MSSTTRPTRRRPARHRLGLAVAAGAVALLGAAVPAGAKELTSGGGTTVTGTTGCSPVTRLIAKGDARVGETGLADITVDYTAKACTKGQAITVESKVVEDANRSVVVWNATGMPLSGRFTVSGIKVRTSYLVTITVRDAATGAVVGSASAYSGATPKGV